MDGSLYFPGKCLCNNHFIDELAKTFVEALPKIADISKMVLFQALTIVLSAPLDAIPGVGEALDAVIDSGVSKYSLPDPLRTCKSLIQI